MSSPTTGAVASSNGFNNVNSANVAITLTAGRLVLVGVMIQDLAAPYTVSTVASDLGSLRFVKIGAKAGVIASQFSGNSNYNLEVWAALGTISNTVTITSTFSGSPNGAHLYITEAIGAGSAPLDSRAGNPFSALNASGSPAVVVSTSQPDDLLLMFIGKDGSSGLAGPGGWSNVVGPLGGGGSGGHGILGMISSFSVSSLQSAVTFTPSVTNGGVAVCVALTSDSGGSSPFCGAAIPVPT